tara:strand:- start:212 stop:394 length:183 start_codon:yes stop_codon:yes gene_type:complete
MGRRLRRVGIRNYPPRRVAYRMTDGRKFYEPQPRAFPYGALPYVQSYYWTEGYTTPLAGG